MKRTELYFSAILVPVDYVMVVLAGIAAYELRFGSTVRGLLPPQFMVPLSDFVGLLLVAAIGFVIIFAISGMYALRGTRRFVYEFTSIFLGCSTGIMAIILAFFFSREFFSSRFIVVSGWFFAVLFVTIGRLIVRAVQKSMLQRGMGAYAVVLVGSDKTSDHLAALLDKKPGLGYHVVTRLPDVDALLLKTLAESQEKKPFDILLQADPLLPKEQTMQLVDFANDHHITFKYAADLFETRATNIAVETLAGIPIIEIRRTRLQGWGRILKRTFDILFALLALILTSPFFLFVPLFIKADSKGPVFYRSKRMGQSGKPFFVLKFRSMSDGAHAMKEQLMQYNERKDGVLFKMKNDPRVTRVGRFIRKTSIDELPQFLNVLKGDMSIVGPRPHEPEEVAKYEKNQKQLMAIKPGVTGLAQISGRSDLNFGEEAKLDIYYIENWSFWMDVLIVLKTPPVVLKMKSAA